MGRADRGRPAGPPDRAARRTARPLATGQGGVETVGPGTKRSGLGEAFAGAGSAAHGWGWEEGVLAASPDRPTAPVTPDPIPAPPAPALALVARRLRREAAQALAGAGVPIAVLVSAASVRWSEPKAGSAVDPRRAGARAADAAPPGAAFVGAATLLAGSDPTAPAWSRTARLWGVPGTGLDPGACWPPGWLEAAARAMGVAAPGGAGRIVRSGHEAPSVAGPDFASAAGTLVVDAFAAGDLLRLGAHRSKAAPGRAAGPPIPGLARGARARDCAAAPGSPPGSWRRAAGRPWEELALEVAHRAAWPDDGLVLTRLVPLRGVLLGAGHLRHDGVPVAGWGPIPIPPPVWWLARIVAALGEPVADATGPPVACPPLLIVWGRRSPSR